LPKTIDSDLDTLRALNPQLLRLVTPADPEFVLQLPAGTAERFSAEIAAIPAEKWLSWRRHTVGPGETLSGVAKRYHVLPAEIARANELQGGAPLEEGKKLIIPAARSDAAAGKLIRYRVRRTDTIASIADEFDVSVAELRKWNGFAVESRCQGGPPADLSGRDESVTPSEASRDFTHGCVGGPLAPIRAVPRYWRQARARSSITSRREKHCGRSHARTRLPWKPFNPGTAICSAGRCRWATR